MKIDDVCISNWRSIKDININFQDLMIFIGQNNHGKSNILSALLFFFGEIKQQDLDFNSGTQELFVDITFKDLDENDKVTFRKYLTSDNKIRVRKTAYIGGNFEYHGYIQNPVDEFLQEVNASGYTKRELAQSLAFYPFLPSSGRLTKQDIIDAQQKYIDVNKSDLTFIFQPEETNFLGLKSVAKGIFGDVYFIPAVKDASDDFSSKESSAFGKMYSKMIEVMSLENPDWKNTKDKLASLFGALNKIDGNGATNVNRPIELEKFEKSLSAELKSWGAEIDVEVTPPDIDDVFRANTQVWVNDGVRTDIKRKGHGLQRAMTYALIKVISGNLKSERDQREREESSRVSSASTYFILEEPELYLHPQAQRALLDSLVDLSESNSQVMLSTHASAFIDVERYKSICIVKKDDEVIGTKSCQCVEDLFTGNKKKDFNMSYWINPDRGEFFFAKRVILVEGATDKTIIPLLAKQLGVFKYDYTLIDCGSKNSIPLYLRLLNKFSVPYVAVYDKDHQSHKNQQAIESADRDSSIIEAGIDAAIGNSVVLINDIEEEIGMVAGDKNKPYAALMHVDSPAFTISIDFSEKIKAMYL